LEPRGWFGGGTPAKVFKYSLADEIVTSGFGRIIELGKRGRF